MPAHRTPGMNTSRQPPSSVPDNTSHHHRLKHVRLSRQVRDALGFSTASSKPFQFAPPTQNACSDKTPHPAKTISYPPNNRTLGLASLGPTNTSRLFCEHDLIVASLVSSMINLTRAPHPSPTIRWITDPVRRTGSPNQHAVASGHANTLPPSPETLRGKGMVQAAHSHFVHQGGLKADFIEPDRDAPEHAFI